MEVVQEILTRVSLAAAGGLIFACFVLRYGAAVLRLAERALRGFAALPFVAKVVLPAFLGVAILYGGSKTNAPPAQLLRSLPRMVPVRWRFADDTVMQRVRFDNWHRRGAVNDWRRVKFADGWVFPSGTNHLASVMVMSRGEIRPRLQNTNAVARLSERLTMRPGEAEFFAERTASNTYRFAWENCRDATNALKSAAVELFRNGDIRVTEQDGVRFLPRQIPFPHNGFGQDADWVRANFTNAEEILSVGYPNWVDAQVGVGLENGLYKLTATFPADPLEATLLKVGNYRVCVTNAGEYVFLLEKGPEYGLAIEPFNDQVTYSMQDDVCTDIPLLMSWGNDWGFLGKWTTDGDWEWLYRPELTDGVLWPGSCCWLPAFFGSPDCAYVGPGGGPTVFTANFRDYRYAEEVHYQWECSDPEVIIVSPNAAETEIRFRTMPSWRSTDISVTATTSNHVYFSELQEFVYGTNSTPQVRPVLMTPTVVVQNGKRRKLRVGFSSDYDEDNGTLRLSCVRGRDRITLWSAETGGALVDFEQSWPCSSFEDFECYIAGTNTSETVDDVEFTLVYASEAGDLMTVQGSVTVVDYVSEPISSFGCPVLSDRPLMNPCAIRQGRSEAYWAILLPTNAPASWLSWRARVGQASFPNGNEGSMVFVDATSSNLVLEALIYGYDDEPDPIEFKVDVVQEDE